MFCILEKEKYIQLMFQNIIQIVRNKLFFVKFLSALLREITSKHHGDFYFLNSLHSSPTEKKLESHKKVCANKNFCNVIMPFEETKIFEFNQYQ